MLILFMWSDMQHVSRFGVSAVCCSLTGCVVCVGCYLLLVGDVRMVAPVVCVCKSEQASSGDLACFGSRGDPLCSLSSPMLCMSATGGGRGVDCLHSGT